MQEHTATMISSSALMVLGETALKLKSFVEQLKRQERALNSPTEMLDRDTLQQIYNQMREMKQCGVEGNHPDLVYMRALFLKNFQLFKDREMRHERTQVEKRSQKKRSHIDLNDDDWDSDDDDEEMENEEREEEESRNEKEKEHASSLQSKSNVSTVTPPPQPITQYNMTNTSTSDWSQMTTTTIDLNSNGRTSDIEQKTMMVTEQETTTTSSTFPTSTAATADTIEMMSTTTTAATTMTTNTTQTDSEPQHQFTKPSELQYPISTITPTTTNTLTPSSTLPSSPTTSPSPKGLSINTIMIGNFKFPANVQQALIKPIPTIYTTISHQSSNNDNDNNDNNNNNSNNNNTSSLSRQSSSVVVGASNDTFSSREGYATADKSNTDTIHVGASTRSREEEEDKRLKQLLTEVRTVQQQNAQGLITTRLLEKILCVIKRGKPHHHSAEYNALCVIYRDNVLMHKRMKRLEMEKRHEQNENMTVGESNDKSDKNNNNDCDVLNTSLSSSSSSSITSNVQPTSSSEINTRISSNANEGPSTREALWSRDVIHISDNDCESDNDSDDDAVWIVSSNCEERRKQLRRSRLLEHLKEPGRKSFLTSKRARENYSDGVERKRQKVIQID